MRLKLSHPSGIIDGAITLEGSKSISNRVLIIQSLCKSQFEIQNLSKSDDTQTLLTILNDLAPVNDVHHAGTAFRFLSSVLAFKSGTQILTGSSRMQERPIGPLVDALRTLGANIEYLNKDGFPPLRIKAPADTENNTVSIDGGVSSQFISSLALIGPTLKNGIRIKIIGTLVSRPYVEMTLNIMGYFGIKYLWEDNTITIHHQPYVGRSFDVESDWSSASYLYAIVALSNSGRLKVNGLFENSLQPDNQIIELSKSYGLQSQFLAEGVIIKKTQGLVKPFMETDFINYPDIAQTVFTINAGLGIHGLYQGLQTLKIKETDRVEAVSKELAKVGVVLTKVPNRFAQKSDVEIYMQEGKAQFEDVIFETYQDHRMAMAFAPLALLNTVMINDAEVVSKSYPEFWNDLKKLGFNVEMV